MRVGMKTRRHDGIQTRPCPGARLRWIAAAAALLACLAAVSDHRPAAAARGTDPDDPDGPGPLPWRVRGQVGFTVDAAAFPDSAGHSLEVYLRIPPATLRSLRRGEDGAARLKLTLRLANRFGGRPQEATQELTLGPADSASGLGKVVLHRFTVRPGGHRLRVRLDDLLSQKRGLGYIGRKVSESVTVEGGVIVPAADAGRDLSDPEFVWAYRPVAPGSAFRRGDRAAVPNPERLYGLLASDLRAEFVARSASTGRPWRWQARLLDGQGQAVAEQESTQAAGEAVCLDRVALDVSTLPAGGYDLEVSAWQEGDAKPVVRRSRCSIAWLASSWMLDPADIDDVAHFLLSAEEEELFARMHPGEREQFLDRFWRERDPTPGTAENEARIEFLGRVEHVNQNFYGPGRTRGMFSDMGRVYIRYGEPDEVLKQVIPAGDQTLNEALRALESTEDRSTGDVHMKGLGGDQRPFEVWIYEGNVGAPPDTDPAARSHIRSRRRLVFLFVDEHGYGNYTLRYSTE
jgi:GWxTD domain-containing protein